MLTRTLAKTLVKVLILFIRRYKRRKLERKAFGVMNIFIKFCYIKLSAHEVYGKETTLIIFGLTSHFSHTMIVYSPPTLFIYTRAQEMLYMKITQSNTTTKHAWSKGIDFVDTIISEI